MFNSHLPYEVSKHAATNDLAWFQSESSRSAIADRRRCMGSWKYYSVKNGHYVPFASGSLLRALYRAEVSHDVVGYRTEFDPSDLRLVGPLAYAPFLEETTSDGRLIMTAFLEMSEESADREYAEAIVKARTHFGARGISLHIRGGPEIDEQPLFDAVEAIQTFRRTPFTDADILLVKDAIGERASAPLGEVRDMFKSSALGFAKLSAMMVRRIVVIDLNQELGPKTPVRMPHPE